MNKTLLLLATIILLPIIISYTPTPKADGDYVPGELIIQLKDDPGQSRTQLLNSLTKEFAAIRLAEIQALSPRMNIWLMSFDRGRQTDQEVLAKVRNSEKVLNAQFNHYVEMRSKIPIDESFDLQWALNNTGQAGGTVDADIDGPEAWEYATGGVAASGDTLIICIVDDGFDLEHLDIDFWKNWHEIPDNSIDDDGNGYVDDYDGWNASSGNPIIIERDHGTHVTGIAAATGNNDRGVCGVNWNTKVLPVVGSSTVESIVVSAYLYVYEMRKLYNDTDGGKGAFIVATNSSFGVNNGQPEDYPIWGAMYDSMGYVGIISAAATANASINVDEEGDIPTAFANEHLVTVTNTTRDDEKNQYAAYGLTTIDLGAPGTEIYSTRQDNSYGYKTGCSMSSPFVAGATALLFSAANTEFMNDYKQDPATFALVIKSLLLQGADPLESLNGITVTGGRLNLYNSMQLFVEPVLEVTPRAIGEILDPEMSQDRTFNVKNTSAQAIDYSITKPASATWLALQNTSGNLQPDESDVINLTLYSTGLAVGVYTTYLDITYDGNSGYSMPVRLEVDTTGATIFLFFTDEELPVGNLGGSVSTEIKSNFSWHIEESAPWVTPDIITGEGNATINFTVDENTWPIARACDVTVENAGLSDVVTITQEAAFEPTLDSDQDTVYIAANAGSYATVEILSNTDWEAIANQSWLVATPPSGSGNMSLTIRAQSANTGSEIRNGSVTLKYAETGMEAKFIIVHQSTSTGLDDDHLSNLINVYPNPSKDKVSIVVTNRDIMLKEIELLNLAFGSISKELGVDMTNSFLVLHLENLPDGIYILRLETNQGSIFKKLMVIR